MIDAKLNLCAKLLIQKGLKIGTAESCTGGLLSHLLTEIPGASKYLLLGVAAYSNQAKMSVLQVSEEVIRVHGAVSSFTAIDMAANVKKTAGADIGIGITGIAGPGGGTPEKPVGTVFVALDSATGSICKRFAFEGDRSDIKLQTAEAALDMIIEYLKSK